MLACSANSKLNCRLFVRFALAGTLSSALCCQSLQAQVAEKPARVNAVNPFLENGEEGDLIAGVVDDRAIKKLISTRAESLLPDPEVSLIQGFEEQLTRTETKLKLPRIKTSVLESHEIYPSVATSVLVLSKIYKCGRCTRWHDRSAGAFVLTAGGAIMTNHHVVAGLKPDERAMVATSVNGKVYVVKEILAADKINDIAILQLELPEGERLQPAKVAAEAFPGEDVYAISHPVGRFFTLTKGVVSRNAMIHTPDGSSKRLYITAEFAKGSSGSPIFNGRGEVVGMVASTQSIYYTETGDQQKNLQMVFRNCIPASSVHSLLK